MTVSVHESRMHAVPVPLIAAAQATAAAAMMSINGHPARQPGRAADLAHGSLYEACVAMREKVDAFLAEEPATPLLRRVQEQVRISVRVVDEALERYRLCVERSACVRGEPLGGSEPLGDGCNSCGPAMTLSPLLGLHCWEEKSDANYGYKTGLVMLIVLLACYARRYSPPKSASGAIVPNGPAKLAPFPERLHAVYIVSADPFAEVDDFVESSSADYHLDIARFMLPMKKGLEVFKAENPSIRAIFVGTRRTDPHGEKLKHFDPTDAGWPDFMRIHPVIDWHYSERS
ncbi:phosphoadenosine phosphosulfate reductase [Trichoderma arundinaceum]|uniref:FAD synthase n=1 Tax=Trichoderma arundinaceum TaxID=490622 RepID=A0A395NBL8_TRIAR|nr:phosphoadenosine phosphosulfate reductase [Trichoderma arundinaceum]